MRRVEGIGDLNGQPDQPLAGQRFAVDQLLESLALEQLHDYERPSLVLPAVVDGADVGVVQSRGSPRLALEPLQRLGLGAQILGEELERHVAAQSGVLGLVDDTHAAAPELREHTIVRNSLANHEMPRSGRRRPHHVT